MWSLTLACVNMRNLSEVDEATNLALKNVGSLNSFGLLFRPCFGFACLCKEIFGIFLIYAGIMSVLLPPY